MGRRSINTTKSGKYMNPTDQARKEARKQELKKNKKQRQMVRAAVLKGKDPQQILEEMEKIDEMEFNVDQPSPLNEKVLKDKRKKLRDTLDRVLSMYYKDDPEKWAALRRQQTDYEMKRNQMMAFFESVRSAQQVTIDEIPLPQLPQQQALPQPTAPTAQIPLPSERKQEHPIYSIATALKLQALGQPVREPPGCPPGHPPDITDEGEIVEDMTKAEAIINEEDEVNDSGDEEDDAMKPTSLQQKMVALSGQNVDDFMKEMESVHKKPEDTPLHNPTTPATANKLTEIISPPGTDLPPPPTIAAPPPAATMMYRLPPGPPPGRPLMPPGPPPGMPPPRMVPPLRMPPPRLLRLPLGPPLLGQQSTNPNPPNVLSAAPQLISTGGTKQGATISAKPQIRSLSADVTRFVPSTLRVKREDKNKQKDRTRALANELKLKEFQMQQQHLMMQQQQQQRAGRGVEQGGQGQQQHTKDDAYKQFMQEMQNLL